MKEYQHLVPIKYICTSCGFHTVKVPDGEGMVECDACFWKMSKEEYEELQDKKYK